MAVIGLTGCATSTASDRAVCDELGPLAGDMRTALLDHAGGVPDPVGEAATRLLVGMSAGCAF